MVWSSRNMLFSAVLLVIVVGMALKSRKRPVVSGKEEMLGAEGLVLEDFDQQGDIRVHGEVWNARSDHPVCKNQSVIVTGRDGLQLKITPSDSKKEAS